MVLLFLELGQAEVGDPGVAQGVEQDVVRLDVAMDHLALVGVIERVGNLGADAGDLPLVAQTTTCRSSDETGAEGSDRKTSRTPGQLCRVRGRTSSDSRRAACRPWPGSVSGIRSGQPRPSPPPGLGRGRHARNEHTSSKPHRHGRRSAFGGRRSALAGS